MSNHTPGPWTSRVNPTSGYGFHLIEANGGEDTIATQVHPVNAKLIAAAPELLAALQAMVSFATKHPSKERNGALYDACAAIAKVDDREIDMRWDHDKDGPSLPPAKVQS